MKVIIRITLMIALFAAGYAAGFPMGRNSGFSTGSEWALKQAGILVREAGLFMPVNYEAGKFRIILKQPKHVYRRAWILADRHEDENAFMCEGDRTLNERIPMIRNTAMLQ